MLDATDYYYIYSDVQKKYIKVLPGLCNYVFVDQDEASLFNQYNKLQRFFIIKIAGLRLKTKLRNKIIMNIGTAYTVPTMPKNPEIYEENE